MPTPHDTRLAPRAWIAAAGVGLAILVIAFGYREIDSPDIGFQLSLGRWILAEGAIPRVDPLTYTLQHRPYVDLQWLYQIVLWLVYSAGGTFGLATLNTLATLAALALALLRSKRREGHLGVSALAMGVLFVLGSDAEIRPHVFSWVYLGLVLLLLEAWARGARRAVWWLPVLMALWTNTHSLYPLGIAAIGAYGLAELFKGRAASRAFLAAAVLSVVACLANPYGVEGIAFPIGQLGMLQAGSIFKAETGITEFASPFSLSAYTANRARVLYQPTLFMHILVVATVPVVVAAWKRVSAAERIVFVLFAYIFWRAQKNHGYFALATLPTLAVGVRRLAELARLPSLPAARPIACAALVALCGLVTLQVRSNWFYANRRLSMRCGHRFNPDFLPVGAAEFLNRDDIPPGNMLNMFNEGGFLGFATQRPVFIDGRAELTGAEFFERYQYMEDPYYLASALEEFDIAMAIFPIGEAPTWSPWFRKHNDWRLVHCGRRSLVYFRSDFAPHVAEYRPTAGARTYSLLERERILSAAIERRPPSLLSTILEQHDYPMAAARRCIFHWSRGEHGAALAAGLEACEQGTIDSADVLLAVANVLWSMELHAPARRCLQAVLDKGGVLNQPERVERAIRARLELPDAPAPR